MSRLACMICLLAGAAVAHSQPLKARFLDDYRNAVAAQEPRLTKNIEVTITGKEFDESGQVRGMAESTFQSNETCMLVTEVVSPGDRRNWYLLRPEGSYRIARSATKLDEYILRQFTSRSGSFSPLEAGIPFSNPLLPLMQTNMSLRDHIAKSEVTVLSDEINESVREVKVKMLFDGKVSHATYRLRTKDMLFDESVLNSGYTSLSYRRKFHYVDIDGESFPSRIEFFEGTPGEASRLTGVTEFGPYRRVSLPDSEFSLTRFGLPEAVNAPLPRRTPLYVWLLVAAGAIAVGACLARFIARRRVKTLG